MQFNKKPNKNNKPQSYYFEQLIKTKGENYFKYPKKVEFIVSYFKEMDGLKYPFNFWLKNSLQTITIPYNNIFFEVDKIVSYLKNNLDNCIRVVELKQKGNLLQRTNFHLDNSKLLDGLLKSTGYIDRTSLYNLKSIEFQSLQQTFFTDRNEIDFNDINLSYLRFVNDAILYSNSINFLKFNNMHKDVDCFVIVDIKEKNKTINISKVDVITSETKKYGKQTKLEYVDLINTRFLDDHHLLDYWEDDGWNVNFINKEYDEKVFSHPKTNASSNFIKTQLQDYAKITNKKDKIFLVNKYFKKYNI